MLLVIAYATFGHSRPSGHLVFHEVAYKDRTRRRVLIAYCLRRGVCSDSKCNTSCLLRNVMLHLVRMANFTPTHTCEELQIFFIVAHIETSWTMLIKVHQNSPVCLFLQLIELLVRFNACRLAVIHPSLIFPPVLFTFTCILSVTGKVRA